MISTHTHSKIKELRESKGLSQEELSERAGISLRTIQRMEAGESTPRGSTLRIIASSLDVPPEFFNIPTKEVNEAVEPVVSKPKKFRLIFPCYLIGFTIIGGALGIILGIILTEEQLNFSSKIEGLLELAIAALFAAMGMIVGNYIEKKNSQL